MAVWFSVVTGEVVESDSPAFPAAERMGPYATRLEAENAFLVSEARNALADVPDVDDDYDAAEREWKENW